MVQNFKIMAQALRIQQWLKNLAVFAAILFTGQLFNPKLFLLSTKAFIIFCLISSGSYLINDIIDADRDRHHPFKKFRPIASGQIKKDQALILAIILILIGLFWSLNINLAFFLTSLFFVILHLLYSFKLKHVSVIDIFIIALGYLIRIYAGEFATGYHITFWLALCAISLSLFLAVGKRRAELTLIQSANRGSTRPSLGQYSEQLLDTYTAMFANSTWITYAYYTFLEKPPRLSQAFGNLFDFMFPSAADRKWLMVTIPLAIYGIMRYMQLIYGKQEGENPEKILITDKPLLTTVIIWGVMVLAIIYIL